MKFFGYMNEVFIHFSDIKKLTKTPASFSSSSDDDTSKINQKQKRKKKVERKARVSDCEGIACCL